MDVATSATGVIGGRVTPYCEIEARRLAQGALGLFGGVV